MFLLVGDLFFPFFKTSSLNFIFITIESQSITKGIKNINYEFTTSKLSEYWIQKYTIIINQNAINGAHIRIHVVSLLCCDACIVLHIDGSYEDNSNRNNMHTIKYIFCLTFNVHTWMNRMYSFHNYRDRKIKIIERIESQCIDILCSAFTAKASVKFRTYLQNTEKK